LPPSYASTPGGRKGIGSTAKFTMEGDGDGGFLELGAVDGVGAIYSTEEPAVDVTMTEENRSRAVGTWQPKQQPPPM
jgi:hypothetical protein